MLKPADSCGVGHSSKMTFPPLELSSIIFSGLSRRSATIPKWVKKEPVLYLPLLGPLCSPDMIPLGPPSRPCKSRAQRRLEIHESISLLSSCPLDGCLIFSSVPPSPCAFLFCAAFPPCHYHGYIWSSTTAALVSARHRILASQVEAASLTGSVP